jgi:hypothetical protein
MGRTLILSCIGLLMTFSSPAQTSGFDSKRVSEPEFADVFYRLETGRLVPLERQSPTEHIQSKGFIVENTKAAYEFPGDKSPVRFPSGRRLEFVVRSFYDTASFDPNTTYVLRKLSSKRKTRELITKSSHSSPLGTSKTIFEAAALPVEFSRYGEASLKMTTSELAPGEYAVGPLYGPAVFCFGVD